jgi:hypothetical protein
MTIDKTNCATKKIFNHKQTASYPDPRIDLGLSFLADVGT